MGFKRFRQCIYCLTLVTEVFAQAGGIPLSPRYKDSVYRIEAAEKDIIDVLKLKRMAGDVPAKGKRSMKLRTTVIPFVGYTLQTRGAAIIAGNAAFYTDEDPQTNQSAISISVSYSQNNQVVFPILSNIWTRKNKYNFLGNWRYYKYPEQTFGLGGHTPQSNPTKVDYSYFLFREAILRHVSNSDFYLGLGYNLSYHGNITQVPAIDGQITDFDLYGRTRSSVSSGLSVHVLFDNRGNTINPQKGAYANVTYFQYSKMVGSDNNWQAVTVDLRKYFNLGRAKNVLALWSYNWFTFGSKKPYLDLPSTGWDAYGNTGRGYIQSRLRGKNMLYVEAEYRFKILPSGLIGGVLFSNAQSVSDWPGNKKFTSVYPAAGLGLRLKLNKYSGTNLAIDYGFGTNGSRGLFINLGEVF